MAKIVFGMNQSLDGYVDHDHQEFAPSPALFRHFIEQVRGLAGSVYGRHMYEVMRYWDEDHPEWDAAEYDFAVAWRNAGAALLQGGDGLTFRRFKLWSALQHAAVRMAERELVRTAAMDAGFADTAHLSRVFSSMFGLSPSVAIAGLDDREQELQ